MKDSIQRRRRRTPSPAEKGAEFLLRKSRGVAGMGDQMNAVCGGYGAATALWLETL